MSKRKRCTAGRDRARAAWRMRRDQQSRRAAHLALPWAEAAFDRDLQGLARSQFAEKLKYIVGLYLSLPEHALVWCCDEKRQVQALDPHPAGVAAEENGALPR